MTPGALIKQARERRAWTQKELADAVGVTAGFVTKVEANQTLPGYELCVGLAKTLGLSVDTLWAAVERVRTETVHQRIRTRGAAVRGAVRTRGAVSRAPLPKSSNALPSDVAREVAADADLMAAYHDLKRALDDPEIRETVLATLRTFARAAHAPGEKDPTQ